MFTATGLVVGGGAGGVGRGANNTFTHNTVTLLLNTIPEQNENQNSVSVSPPLGVVASITPSKAKPKLQIHHITR